MGSVETKITIDADISNGNFTANSPFTLDLRNAVAATFSVNVEQVEITYSSGSVVINVKVFATSSSGAGSLGTLNQVAETTFNNEAAAQAYITAQTNQGFTVTALTIAVNQPPSGSGSSGLSGGAIAGIVIGVLAGVLLMLAGVYFLTKSNRSHAPQFDAGQTPLVTNDPSSKKSTGSGFGAKSSRKPPTSYPGEKTPFAVAHTDAARGGQPIEFAENI